MRCLFWRPFVLRVDCLKIGCEMESCMCKIYWGVLLEVRKAGMGRRSLFAMWLQLRPDRIQWGLELECPWTALALQICCKLIQGAWPLYVNVMALTAGLLMGEGLNLSETVPCVQGLWVSAGDIISWAWSWSGICMDCHSIHCSLSLAYFLVETIILSHVIKPCSWTNNHCLTKKKMWIWGMGRWWWEQQRK